LLDGIVVDVRDVWNCVADMAKGSRMQIGSRSNKIRGDKKQSQGCDGSVRHAQRICRYLQTARLGRARK
jgi:hypothetical protein